MSYILDALKRAEADRARGAVPGLHTQPSSTTPQPRLHDKPSHIAWWLGAGVVAVVALGATALFVPALMSKPAGEPGSTARRPALPTTQPSQPGSTVTADATRSAPPINPTEVGTATTTPPQASSPSIPVREQSGGAMPHRRSSGAQGAQPLAAAASASRAAPTLPTLLELPEELRRQLPTLQITGAVYSANAAQRLLLVNGQVLPEGSKLSPELVIDEIGPHSALLSFQGRRFQAAY